MYSQQYSGLDLSIAILRRIGVFHSFNLLKWRLNIFRVIILMLISLIIILVTVQLFVAPDPTQLARTIDVWTVFISGLYKWCYMTMFNDEYLKLYTTLAHIQTQGSIVFGKSADQFTNNYLKITYKASLGYLITTFAGALIVFSSPFIVFPQSELSNVEYFNDPKTYPLPCWIPFSIINKWMFSAILIIQYIAIVLIMTIYLTIDIFMYGSIFAAGEQIELLKSSINKIENYLEINENSTSCVNQLILYTDEQQTLCYSLLKKCTKHHILILNYIKTINTLFSSLIIVDYVHGITSLTFALFQLTISCNLGECIVVVIFITVSIWHQFLNNFFGEFIVEKQLSIYTELYHIPWWRANKKTRYLLTFMIWRSIKPTTITGLYMYKLGYRSFFLFVKTFFKLYVILKHASQQDN